MRQALAVLVFALLGCAAPTAPASVGTAPAIAPERAAVPKRITAAVMSDPPSISSNFVAAGSGTIQGGDALEDLANAGLTVVDNKGTLRPQLAQDVPTLENGLWKLFPGGRMETTWTLRPGALWHDGTPVTTEDLLFTARLGQDRELALFRDSAYDLIERIDTPDARTITVAWKVPYIQADSLFTRRVAMPRPRHILEPTYRDNKEAVTLLPYWSDEYVGAGPFKLRQFVRSSHLIMVANDQYVLGRPKIDEIEVRFIPNGNALQANILAGEIHLTLGRNLSLKQALQTAEQWREGTTRIGYKNWIALYPQLLNPNPAILTNLQFRRALAHALDRQQLVDTLLEGKVPVAHTFLSPSEPSYKTVEPRIVKYDYDVRRSAQLIEGLGYAKGPDGIYRDSAGQRLSLEVRTSAEDDTHEAGTISVADFYRQVGIGSEVFMIPQAQRNDREFNATYPGVRLWRLSNDAEDLRRYSSKDAPLPENRFSGSNRSRYMNPEFDGMVDRFMTTIPLDQRMAVLGDIINHMTDQVTIIGLWYNTEPVMISNRLSNITVRDVGPTSEAWNAHEWDLK